MPHDPAYLLAEEKIEEALKSGATELNLRNMKLTKLPESIGQLSHLLKLDIGSDYINKTKNKLSKLPESLGHLENLQTLDAENNQLTSWTKSLSNLKRLQSLNLQNNQLKTLPESFRNLTHLQFLNLFGNKLKKLPKAIGQLKKLKSLYLNDNYLTELPKSLGQLRQLRLLDLSGNELTSLPDFLCSLKNLTEFAFSDNQISSLPDWIEKLEKLEELYAGGNKISSIPNMICNLENLRSLVLGGTSISSIYSYGEDYIRGNNLITVPICIAELPNLENLNLDGNPLDSELAKANEQGTEAIITYLRAQAEGQIILNEAKLILVGEGGVGKTCLLDALLEKPWQEHPSTHGIEIQQVKVSHPIDALTSFDKKKKSITLNGWDFGGQRVYRPTHQLFFSAPAVYLVVWKPREGPQQGFVREWIQLVKRREPSAKIIVVATHGGPQQRQPDIDRQELWDLFGKDTVVDFFFVDSKPDEHGHRKGITELKEAIARVAGSLPEVGRSVPKSFADVRAALDATGAPYLPFDEVLAICRAHHMDDEIARLFITISHRLGHLTHYENDPALRDIVILRPDWLASAMSYVLDDEETRVAHGLVDFSRLSHLWDDPTRPADTRYPPPLHRIFLRLMERFDLSYRVAGLSKDEDSNPVSLIAQLVPDTTPKEDDFTKAWTPELTPGDIQQTQICRIVDAANGQSANAEGLFFQLIVRLHRYSLGRVNYNDSVHWHRGLILDADYNGRALLRHINNDVHITVRAPFPERFLGMITEEVKYLVESFWEGLRCDVTVPCLATPECKGLFEVSKLMENMRRNRTEQPCSICNEWQDISQLLANAPAGTQPISLNDLQKEFAEIKDKIDDVKTDVNSGTRRVLSKVDKAYDDLIRVFADEAKEGPRLFSIRPVGFESIDKLKNLTSYKLRVQLWCEHSQLPLFILNDGDTRGQYDLEMPREWVLKAAPYLNALNTTLGLVLPTVMSGLKFTARYEDFENQLALGKEAFAALAKVGGNLGSWATDADAPDLPHGQMQRAEGALLRELHAFLKEKDPGFGGLVRVLNKRNEFLWVHEKFAGEY